MVELKQYFVSCMCIFLMLIMQLASAQKVIVDSMHTILQRDSVVENGVPQRDLIDYTRIWFGFKPNVKSEFKPGDKPVLSVLPAAGYTLQTRLAGLLSGNLAFFTSVKKGSRLSVINASVGYSQNKQFFIPVQTNVWLWNDRINLQGDLRYMKYPQSTFGLGSNAPFKNENPMDFQYVRFYQYFLYRFGKNFLLGPGFNLDNRWKISEKGLAGNQPSDYVLYGASSSSISTGYSLNLLYDSRKNPINANNGLELNLVLRNNPTAWNQMPWSSVVFDARKYIPVNASKKNVLALWSYTWLITSGKPPYLDLPSTGWDVINNSGRGYIQGRFRGKHFLYNEAEYRFRITANGFLGAVVFANVQTVSGWPDNRLQQLQPGAGGGIRLKLNKKSNTNVSIDYGFGANGSRGLFVNVGEVF
jgi:outer membrane protein assembly factor BamA